MINISEKITNKTKFLLFTILALALFNYGFMQVRILSVPLAEIALLLFLITTNLPLLFKRFSKAIVPFPFLLWWSFGIASASYYFIENGIWALRDASNILESLYLLVGFSIFSKSVSRNYIINKYPVFLLMACIYGLTYPFATSLQKLSPVIMAGAGHYVPVFFTYVNSSMLLLISVLYLSINKYSTNFFLKHAGKLTAFLMLFTVGFFQTRTIYLQIILLFIILLIVRPASSKKWLYIIIGAMFLLGFFSFFGVEIEGRLGQKLSANFLLDHFMAIFGVESVGVEGAAKGVSQRLDWWIDIYTRWSNSILTIFMGLGFGFPLIDFIVSGSDAVVREPHNSYISVLARSGLIGFSLWLWIHWLLLKAWRFSFKTCRKVNWLKGEVFLIVALGYFVMIWVLAIGEDSFEKPYNAVPYYFLFGIVIRISWYAKLNRINSNGVIGD